ncbi:putative MFS family arabinose efflux permease [Microbacterium sp. AG790]|uniref:MFS transporter n=1 Tax=Microbacterium sp. AG790 TaxID=2183995 RepID=UPI000EB1D969|nr:MFS transporter [Microbacterium sp. AG790]RKS86621.1 putative MFS family arabinose efflux permease [Microbacterium sp. AG790]
MTTTSLPAAEALAPASAPSPRRSRAAHSAGFWTAVLSFAVAMAFSTIPTPLYALYQQRDGFSPIVVTVIFAAYAVGVAVSLYLVGHVSDWWGRRSVFLAALAVEIVAAVMFLLWQDVTGLIVARFVSGIGIGGLTATATAHIAELRAVAVPSSTIAPVVSNFANIGGLAVGPLVAGVLITWVPAPLETPYAVFLVLLVIALVATAAIPETVDRGQRRRYRPQRIAIPAAARGAFWAAGTGAFTGFAVFGLMMALTPTVLAQAMGVTSRLAAGAVPFAVFMSAAVAQVLTVRLTLRRQLLLSWILMGAGIALVAVAVAMGALAPFVIGGIAAGAGVGVMFRASLGVAGSLAPTGSRGEVLAAIFLIAYVGLAVPTLLIGAALAWLPLPVVLGIFAGLVLVLISVATPRMVRRLAA